MEVPSPRTGVPTVEKVLQEREPGLGGTQTPVKLIIGNRLRILKPLQQGPQSFLLGLQSFLQFQETKGEGFRHLRQSVQLSGEALGAEPRGW